MSRIVTTLIQRLTGRTVRIDPAVSMAALAGYLGRQLLDSLRGLLHQIVALHWPRLMFLAPGAAIGGIGRVTYGTRLRLGRGSRMTCWSRGGIVIGRDFSLGEWCTIMNGFNPFSAIGTIRIGDNVGIGGYAYICCPSSIEIGDDTIVGQYLSIHPQEHVFADRDRPIRLQGVRSRGVGIGRDCWIGAKVTILDGVMLGDGCVVAAGAVVTKSFAAGSIIGGVPARLIANR